MDERGYWLGFSAFPGVGPIRFQKLLRHFGTACTAWSAEKGSLSEVLGVTLGETFDRFREKFSLEEYQRRLLLQGVSFITLADNDYPSLLKQIKNPPFVLYTRGNAEILRFAPHQMVQGFSQNDIFLGVVGTRKITSYGREVTEMITKDLVEAGCIIVSGLAIGVDAFSHQATIDNGGKTIAVLGCGIDCCSPKENTSLYQRILESGGGVIVSEYPLSAEPTKGSFPSRNRIIAGLSHGVVVTEGAEDSGALITADCAIENGRKVFAVPGPITSSLSKGPYKLIAKGGKLVTSAADILADLGLNKTNPPSLKLRRAKGETKEEQRIIDLLAKEPLHFDQIVKLTKSDTAAVGVLLSMMEIKGVVKKSNTGMYSL